jgi:hypothetical protein
MAEKLREHPILTYVTFVLPILLLAIAAYVQANVFLIIIILVWLGVAMMMLFLPIESDNGSSS